MTPIYLWSIILTFYKKILISPLCLWHRSYFDCSISWEYRCWPWLAVVSCHSWGCCGVDQGLLTSLEQSSCCCSVFIIFFIVGVVWILQTVGGREHIYWANDSGAFRWCCYSGQAWDASCEWLIVFMKACEGCVRTFETLPFPKDRSDLLETHCVNILCNILHVIMHLCAVMEERMCLCVRRVHVWAWVFMRVLVNAQMENAFP